MKNTFGNSLSVTLFGESHGPYVGAVIDGLAPGLDLDEERIASELSRRRPGLSTDTPRVERDNFSIISGVFNKKTTGSPLTIIIPNENTKSQDYVYGAARPSHADYSAHVKYHGFEDYRGGGHFSGRVTAALTAAGGIILPALEGLGIQIGTHISSCAGINDRAFEDMGRDIKELREKTFPVLDSGAGAAMQEAIIAAKDDNDSVGGITETVITGLPAGIGEPWFETLDGSLAYAMFSIGAVKGVEFGAGFGLAKERGSKANDALRCGEDGSIYTLTNNNGGINGGISNGMPILFRCAVKPTPSISRSQKTVDFVKGENIDYTVKGRHDPAIIRRICPVIDSVSAITIADALCVRYGTDCLAKGIN